MVLAGKGSELWNLGWKCFPEMMPRFERLKDGIDTAEKLRVLDRSMKPCRSKLLHALLQCAPERLAVMEMTGCPWSDWGSPERILSGLERFGKQPAGAEFHSLSLSG